MNFSELVQVLWRRKAIALAALTAVMFVAFASLALQDKQYKSTSTLALVPEDQVNAIYILSQASTIAPLYAEAVTSELTLAPARAEVRPARLAKINVRSFSTTPVLKIEATSSSSRVAQRSAEAVTSSFLNRLENGQVGVPQLRVQPLDTPALPTTPFSPQPKLVLSFGLLLGLGLGVGTALAWDNLARRVEEADELVKITGMPLYGEIPSSRSIPDVDSAEKLVGDQSLRLIAEALRDLRTNIQFTEGGARSVLVTSPEGRHGKTTISFGLAVMFARTGARTLLVDGDLRRGRLADLLHLPTSPGLSDTLEGLPPTSAVQDSGFPSLSVMTSGELLDDPAELLENSFFSVLHRLERDFDVIVIDGTPLLPINDARILARYTGVRLMVVSTGAVTRRQLRTALERLSIIAVPLTAAVLNNVKVTKRSSYERYLQPISQR